MANKPVILALDLATRFGWCVGEIGSGNPASGGELFAPEGSGSQAIFGCAMKRTRQLIRDHNVNRIVIEAPLDPRHLKKTTRATAMRLMGLPACVEGTAYLSGVYDVTEVRADAVRYSLLGRRVKKAEAKELVIWGVNARGFECSDDDEADAIAIWLYACKEMAGG